jgi:hypothetical protein
MRWHVIAVVSPLSQARPCGNPDYFPLIVSHQVHEREVHRAQYLLSVSVFHCLLWFIVQGEFSFVCFVIQNCWYIGLGGHAKGRIELQNEDPRAIGLFLKHLYCHQPLCPALLPRSNVDVSKWTEHPVRSLHSSWQVRRIFG